MVEPRREFISVALAYKLQPGPSDETGNLQRILNVVSDGFSSWYGLRPSFLNLDSVRLVSPEEFNELRTLQYHKDNYLIKALSMLSVPYEDMLSPFEGLPFPTELDNYLQDRQKDLELGLYITDPIESPNTILMRKDWLQALNGRNPVNRDLLLAVLGVRLSLLAIEMVPQLTNISDELWNSELREVLTDKMNVYLKLHTSKIPPDRIPLGSSASDLVENCTKKGGFFHNLIYGQPDEGIKGDDTLRFLTQGGRIFAVLDDLEKERGFMSFGASFNRKVATILNRKLGGYIISHFTGQYDDRTRASMLEELREGGLMKEQGVEDADKLLSLLKLRSTSEIASAYFGNRLINIFLQRLLEESTKIENQPKQKSGKKAKVAKPREIPLYPLL